MTELIVALDGRESADLMVHLYEADVRWFKVGPLLELDTLEFGVIEDLIGRIGNQMGLKLFRDAKLADHGPYVVTEYIKRLAEKGYASVSTSTDAATEQAVRAAEGTDLRVWRHVAPTSQEIDQNLFVSWLGRAISQGADGAICGAHLLRGISMEPQHLGTEGRVFDFVCPGVRFDEFEGDDHSWITEPKDCARRGVTYAVVGRPIYRVTNPVEAARRYMNALNAP